MGINMATVKFRNDLLCLINKSGLPACNVSMVLEMALAAVEKKMAEDVMAEQRIENEGGKENGIQ